ncbi:MAG: cytoplasmic protein [Actinomycetes bacterium]
MSMDPIETNPESYKLIFENDQVRVLEYLDQPGYMTKPHRHPDSVMYTLSTFARRLHVNGATRDVEINSGTTSWLPSQIHAGENIGNTDTHVIFVELKSNASLTSELGPQI